MSDNNMNPAGYDDPNRGPLDRAANAVTGGTGGISAAMDADTSTNRGADDTGVVSAIFDNNDEAQTAISALRAMGVDDARLSVIAQSRGTITTREGGGEITDEENTNVLRGILGGGAAGAGLAIAALAIPGVGPLVAAGAIAASAVPGALAMGAVAGAVAGTFNETLKKHGIDEEDATYYGDRLKDGGTLVTAHVDRGHRQEVQETLYRNGGHSASSPRGMTR